MQIRKCYKNVNPGLMYAEVKDFILKKNIQLDEAKIETFLVASFSSRRGDNEKIAVRVTAQYEDSFKASRNLPKRNNGVEVAMKYTRVDKKLQGQFSRT